MGEFSLTHILLVAVIFLIFFGPSRLPQMGQSLGKALRGFKEGLSEIDAEVKEVPPERPQIAVAQPAAPVPPVAAPTMASVKPEDPTGEPGR